MRWPLLLVAGLAAALPGAAAGDVRVEGAVHLRASFYRNAPSTDVLFDPAGRVFSIDDYLATAVDSTYGSMLAELMVDGRHLDGALRWRLDFDTGEMRVRSFPELAAACDSSSSPSGIDVGLR